MDISYMKKLEAEHQIGEIAPREPMSEEEIQELELKYNKGNEFPKAFREYLFLAGKWGGEGIVDPDFDDLRNDCEEDMEACGYSLDRPFFVFDNYDSQYSIFFLDEEKEDPDVHILSPFLAKGNSEPLLKKSFTGTFSKLIDEAIYRIKNDIPF